MDNPYRDRPSGDADIPQTPPSAAKPPVRWDLDKPEPTDTAPENTREQPDGERTKAQPVRIEN